MVVWSGKKVARFLEVPPEVRVQPNGVELRVSEVWRIHPETVSIFNGKIRTCDPEKEKILPDNEGFFNLTQGTYEVRIANKVTVPANAVGRMHPRSTLNRLGTIKSDTALWDSGYSGFGTQTIHVPIKLFRVHKDEFWFQLTLEDCEPSEKQYGDDGHWQGERPK